MSDHYGQIPDRATKIVTGPGRAMEFSEERDASSAIDGGLMRLSSLTEDLLQTMERLETRLYPITDSYPVVGLEEGAIKPLGGSPVASRLQDLADRLEHLRRRMTDVIDHLEV